MVNSEKLKTENHPGAHSRARREGPGSFAVGGADDEPRKKEYR
jgi:hypothetical protein